MDAEEILKALAASNPDIAKAIEILNKPKKRGRPKKVKEVKKDDNGIFIPNNKPNRQSALDPSKTLTKSEPVNLKKIQKGDNFFSETPDEKDSYYNERPNEKKMYKTKPIERNRESNLVTKKCEECHTKVKVPAICAAAEYFRCDECLINKGKNKH